MKNYKLGTIVEDQEMSIQEIIEELGTFIEYYATNENRIPVCMEQAIIKLRELEEIKNATNMESSRQNRNNIRQKKL